MAYARRLCIALRNVSPLAKSSFGAETGQPCLREGRLFLGASSSFGAETGTETVASRHARKFPRAKELLLSLACLSFNF